MSDAKHRVTLAPHAKRRRAANRRIEVTGFQAVEERLRLQQTAAALGADLERLRPFADRLLVRVDDQPRADGLRHLIAELDHFAELVGGVDVEKREGNRSRKERFLRQPKEDG